MRRVLGSALTGLALLATMLWTGPAHADFHFMVIQEVLAGIPGNADVQFVELRMTQSGQNRVDNHPVTFFDAAGLNPATTTFQSNVTASAMNTRILIATTAAETHFGIQADLEVPSTSMNGSGGKVCFDSVDCMAWGNYTGSASGVGTPFSALTDPEGDSANRIVDGNNSATDFTFAAPTPQNNASDITVPDTTITAGPSQPTVTHEGVTYTTDEEPTFSFTSSEAGSTFECRIDSDLDADYEGCSTPVEIGPLTDDTHTFDVRATDAAGNVDQSPARRTFVVVDALPDVTQPTVTIDVPAAGIRYRKADLATLSGTANDPPMPDSITSDVDVTELALRQVARVRKRIVCKWFKPLTSTFVRAACKTPPVDAWFEASGTADWTHDVTHTWRATYGRRAPLLNYGLYARTTDNANNTSEHILRVIEVR